MEVIKKLRCRCGEFAIKGAVLVLIGMLVIIAVLEGLHITTTVNQVYDKANAAVLSVAAANVPNVWNGSRDSSGTARHFDGLDWHSVVTTAEVESAMCTSLGLTAAGDSLVHQTGARPSYRIENLTTHYVNVENGQLSFTTTLTVSVPLSIAGSLLPPITKRLEVKTTYEPKF